nr:MAG TPA: hypothetical protein [Caudoviricetes sp.]
MTGLPHFSKHSLCCKRRHGGQSKNLKKGIVK